MIIRHSLSCIGILQFPIFGHFFICSTSILASNVVFKVSESFTVAKFETNLDGSSFQWKLGFIFFVVSLLITWLINVPETFTQITWNIQVFSKLFTVITVISQINTGATENSLWTEISFNIESSSPTMITPIIVAVLKLVGPFLVIQ